MAFEESQQFCAQCQQYVLARRPGTNHVLHLLLSVFTCGLWAIVWLLSSAKVGGWRCSRCGGTRFGAAEQGAGDAPRPAMPRPMVLGASVGGFFGLVLLVGMCSAMRRPGAEEIDARAREAEAEELAKAKAETAAKKAAKSAIEQWKAPPDVEELGRIRGGGGKPESIDRTGRELEILHYKIHGWTMVDLARYKTDHKAWSLHVNGGFGEGCKPERWAPSVTLIEDEGRSPLHARWYRLEGGPLGGLIAKGHLNSSDCWWLMATPEYAQRRRWKHSR